VTSRRPKRRLLAKAALPPAGFMWWYWRLVPIEEVERYAKAEMDGFDRLPRLQRDKLNYMRLSVPKRKR